MTSQLDLMLLISNILYNYGYIAKQKDYQEIFSQRG